ncbi:Fe-S cluster assembly sulfur transfer protein SufU [Aliikangiella coralliicola]|uniref:SUF system NifU family Fe-S cluster assembly protein n=1 Tax=Aliikangiella coralliicola TaxID=2592383 RepID=A0A545U6I6_9GAMM|nr:SUF system NifU family Fe-S cluster assembly protein [Aliikangiella coralliicola]TQV85044.1 SUF system NifU family Fe-S cluster assembly protein [Aliikangiella coralliicola]
MSLKQLYQQTIKQHSQSPIGANAQFTPTHQAEGYNPSCGDELDIYLQLEPTKSASTTQIKAIGFHSDACAICTASASMLCEHSEGKTVEELQKCVDDLSISIKNRTTLSESLCTSSPLNCLTAVSAYPSRINCALLPWQTLGRALQTAQKSTQS